MIFVLKYFTNTLIVEYSHFFNMLKLNRYYLIKD